MIPAKSKGYEGILISPNGLHTSHTKRAESVGIFFFVFSSFPPPPFLFLFLWRDIYGTLHLVRGKPDTLLLYHCDGL